MSGDAGPSVASREGPLITQPARPCLLGLGTATPPLRVVQAEVADRLARLWGLSGHRLARWQRIVAGTQIDARFGVLPLEEVIELSTRSRMEAYEHAAPPLADEAARGALERAGIDAGQVTDLFVVTCTGFSAPGVDVALIEGLGLRHDVRRTVVGFMGCFGAIIGLRSAAAVCRADPEAVALVLCLELCSLHLRADRSPQNQVASAIFGDGAAAAVVSARNGTAMRGGEGDGRALGTVTLGHSRLIPRGRDWMTWRITDAGFAMRLTRDVPAALQEEIATIVDEVSPRRPEFFAAHPGGAAILDAIDEALGTGGCCGLEVSRAILRRFGNMSSATVLFVLDRALRCGYEPPGLLLAFGPGLAVESILIDR